MHSWATEEPCAELQRLGQGQAGGRSHAFTFGESHWLRPRAHYPEESTKLTPWQFWSSVWPGLSAELTHVMLCWQPWMGVRGAGLKQHYHQGATRKRLPQKTGGCCSRCSWPWPLQPWSDRPWADDSGWGRLVCCPTRSSVAGLYSPDARGTLSPGVPTKHVCRQ